MDTEEHMAHVLLKAYIFTRSDTFDVARYVAPRRAMLRQIRPNPNCMSRDTKITVRVNRS
jgi:hypothetical protein